MSAQKNDRVIVTRPYDPLNRDPVRPNDYEVRMAMTGTPTQLALQSLDKALGKKLKEMIDAK